MGSVLVALTAVFAASGYEPVAGFAGADFTASGGMKLPWRFKAPDRIEDGKRYPLLLVMHGMGSIGNDNAKQLFTAGMVARNPEVLARPCFILAPQCPADDRWVRVENGRWNAERQLFSAEPAAPLAAVLELLDRVVAEYPVDPARIYVGGASMGGFATYDLLARRPGFFAAGFPVCGGVDPAAAVKFDPVPLWIFHGAIDPTVPVRYSRELAEARRERNSAETRYSEYPEAAHDAWTPAFADRELFRWLFQQQKGTKDE